MRYLSRLEADLVAASRTICPAPDRSTNPVSPRVRSLARRRPAVSAAAAVMLVAAATAGIADAAGVFNGPDLTKPSPLGTAHSIPQDLAASFAVFRRARDASTDAVPGTPPPGLTVMGGLGRHYGINLALSRYVGTVHGIPLWLIPGDTGTCLYTPNDGSSCAANDSVSTSGLVITEVSVSGGPTSFLGVVPDGATVTTTDADGSPGQLTTSGPIFSVSADDHLRSVVIHETDGQAKVLPAPIRGVAPPPTGET